MMPVLGLLTTMLDDAIFVTVTIEHVAYGHIAPISEHLLTDINPCSPRVSLVSCRMARHLIPFVFLTPSCTPHSADYNRPSGAPELYGPLKFSRRAMRSHPGRYKGYPRVRESDCRTHQRVRYRSDTLYAIHFD